MNTSVLLCPKVQKHAYQTGKQQKAKFVIILETKSGFPKISQRSNDKAYRTGSNLIIQRNAHLENLGSKVGHLKKTSILIGFTLQCINSMTWLTKQLTQIDGVNGIRVCKGKTQICLYLYFVKT